MTAVMKVNGRTFCPQQIIDQKVEKSRDPIWWKKNSCRHRSAFRWDVETELQAVIDWADMDSGSHLEPRASYKMDWLPVERAAARALNALRHAVLDRQAISEESDAMRRKSATDSHRLIIFLAQRRRAWSIFQVLLAEYRALKGAE